MEILGALGVVVAISLQARRKEYSAIRPDGTPVPHGGLRGVRSLVPGPLIPSYAGCTTGEFAEPRGRHHAAETGGASTWPRAIGAGGTGGRLGMTSR
jgi:hypothetical protein